MSERPRGDASGAGRRWAIASTLAGSLVLAVVLVAQVPEGWQAGMRYQREMIPERQRAGFTFCRLMYQSVRTEALGMGWSTDYPMADRNMMIRLGEFTTTGVNLYEDGEPAHAVVRPTDPELFQCPFIMASDIGTAGFSEAEATALREYFLKGGFLWVDDFWGHAAMGQFLSQMQRILPGHERVVFTPDHPIFSTFYFIERLPQIPAIQFWRSSGGQTSERGAESAIPTLSGIYDENGRLVVLMSHNTDIADGMERESDDHAFFERFSPYAYAVAINVAIYAMTR